MFDKGMLFILNQGWRLGIVILCVILIRAILKRVTWRGASYLLWCSIPICYFYMVGVDFFNVFYYKVVVKTSNAPYHFLGEKEGMVFKIIWCVGCFGMLTYMGYSFMKAKFLTAKSIHFRENIYIIERSDMPFTIGVMKPRIYLPIGMQEEFYEPVICHEKVHIARKDYLIKNFVFVLLAINWFQPLMWLAYFLFVKDMEITCDEVVLRESVAGFRKQYARALLELSTREVRLGVVATGYGNVALKERLKNISKNQRVCIGQRFFITVMCIAMILLSVPTCWYIRKPFGYKSNEVVSTNEVWEVRTRIYP